MNDLSEIRKFDLNIEEVLENWEIYHALREIIANALDEQILTKTTYNRIVFKKEFKRLIHRFRNIYDLPDEYENINVKIQTYEEKMEFIEKRNLQIEAKLDLILSKIG